jgi:hypothetical protein
MKKLLCLSAFFLLCAVSCFAQAGAVSPDDCHYSTVQLVLLSVLGILIHWFVDANKAKKQGVWHSFTEYINDTWMSSFTSFLICLLVIMVRHEMMQIPNFTTWEGGVMALCGYFGDSLIPLALGFAKTKGLNLDNKDKP